RAFAQRAVAVAGGVRDLDSHLGATLSPPFAVAARRPVAAVAGGPVAAAAGGLHTESTTIAVTPELTCEISDERRVGDERRVTGTCNAGELSLEAALSNSEDRYHAQITMA